MAIIGVNMRYLSEIDYYWVRLGWLRWIAREVGEHSISASELKKRFNDSKEKETLQKSMKDAGLNSGVWDRQILRIGQIYNITTGTTDIQLNASGLLLYHHMNTQQNLFVWDGAERWIGFWLYFSSAGDVFLDILKNWDGESRSLERVMQAMHRLYPNLKKDEQNQFDRWFERKGTPNAFQRIVSPYLEPLSELGIVAKKGNDYALTEFAKKLKKIFNDNQTATQWLETGIFRAFQLCHNKSAQKNLHSASDALRNACLHIPEKMRVADRELSLEILCRHAQANVINSGIYFDIADVRDILKQVERVSNGKLFTRKAVSLEDSSSVVWTDDEIFQEHYWTMPNDTTSEFVVPMSNSTPAEAPAINDIPLDPPIPPNEYTLRALPPRMSIWMRYLLESTRQHHKTHPDIGFIGGWTSNLSRLEYILDLPVMALRRKRNPDEKQNNRQSIVDSLLPLVVFLDQSDRKNLIVDNDWETLGSKAISLSLKKLIESWQSDQESSEEKLRFWIIEQQAFLARIKLYTSSVRKMLSKTIIDWVSSDGDLSDWPKVREATFCLLEDARDSGWWIDIRYEVLKVIPSLDSITQFLETIGREAQTISYKATIKNDLAAYYQQFLPKSSQNYTITEDNGTISIEKQVKAVTERQAKSRGWNYVKLILRSWKDNSKIETWENQKSDTVGMVETDIPDVKWLDWEETEPEEYLLQPFLGVETSKDESRIQRASMGLMSFNTPNPAIRLSDAWATVESLVVDGDSKGDVAIRRLAALATLIYIRNELEEGFYKTQKSIIELYKADEESIPIPIVEIMVPQEIRRLLKGKPKNIRKNCVTAISHQSSASVISTFLSSRANLKDISDVLKPSDISQSYFCDVWYRRLTDKSKSDGQNFASYARYKFKRTKSWLWHIYEKRNKVAHDGYSQDIEGFDEMEFHHGHFSAFAQPILAECKALIKTHSLSIIFCMAEKRCHELCNLTNLEHEYISELLFCNDTGDSIT